MKNYLSVDIVFKKYTYLDKDLLYTLAKKYKIPVFYTEAQKTLAFKTIPKALLDEKFLKDFYNRLHPKEQEILRYIVNYDEYSLARDVKKKFNFSIEVMQKDNATAYVWWLDLFLYEDVMDKTIQNYFLKFLAFFSKSQTPNQPLSYDASVEDITKITIEKFSADGKKLSQKLSQTEVFESISIIRTIYILAKNNKINVTQKGILALRSSKLLEENLSVEPYYHIWFLSFLTSLEYLSKQKIKTPLKNFDTVVQKNDAEMIKDIFMAYIGFYEQYEFLFAPFPTLNTKGELIQNFRKHIITLIKQQNTQMWISVDAIVDLIPMKSKTLKEIMNGGKYAYGFSDKFGRNVKYDKLEDLKVVVRYFIKTFVAVLNHLGMCSVAKTAVIIYTKEDLANDVQSHPKRFNDIEYFKISDLGKYVLDINKNFISSNDFTLSLNHYSLDIKVQNHNNLSEMFLTNIASKVTDEKYKVDIKTFMQNINTAAEYKNTKDNFIQKCDALPDIWEQFFVTLEERMEGAKVVSQSAVLIKLQNNKELLKLISTHEKLKSKILKADSLHMVVLKDDLPYVKKTLKEVGILI